MFFISLVCFLFFFVGFVAAFYDKVQERLDVHDCHKFLEICHEFEVKTNSVEELYKSVEAILSPKYPDLIEEFLTFLTPSQAKNVGRFMPHFMLTKMSLFLRKLEIFFKDQPAQVKKIYNCLNELSDIVDLSMEKVRSTMLPLLKGNQLLSDWFLQIFPTEKPSNR